MAFDAATYSFNFINNEKIHFLNERYISYLTQSPALLFIKMGFSFPTVLTVYSITFGLWYYLLFLITNYLLKNPKGVVLLIFSLCLTLRYKHYAGHTEIVFAIMVASQLFIWLTTDKAVLNWYKKWMEFPVIFLLCALLYIIHPVIVIPLTIILFADIIKNRRWTDWQNWLSIGFIWLTFVIRYLTINPYETKRAGRAGDSLDLLLNPGNYPIITDIIRDYYTTEYIFVFPLFIIALILLVFQKEYLLAVYLMLSSIALVILNMALHSYLGGKILILIDGYMGMLGMVYGLAIIYAFNKYFQKKWALVGLGLLIISCLYQIQEKHAFFEKRLEAFDKTFEMNPGHNKLFVRSKDFNWSKMWYPYSIHFETLMWTSWKGGKENSKFIFIGTKKHDYKPEDNPISRNIFPMDNKPDKYLNSKYFSLPDTVYFATEKVGWKE